MNGGGAKQLEYCLRLCEKELQGSSSNVKCETLDMMSRKITFLDACATCWMVSATSDVASEPPTDEQVVCQDLLGELSCSLSGMRTEVCNWEKKLQEVFDDNTLLLATTYQPRSCRGEGEFCGFAQDHFFTEGDSVQLTWIESRLKESLNFQRCADLGIDDGDRMVTILNRLVTCHRDMLLADEYGRIRHLHCLMRWVRDADRHIKEFDCANDLGVQEIREHRNPGVHLHREVSGGRRTRESACFDTVWMRKGIKVPTMDELVSCLER